MSSAITLTIALLASFAQGPFAHSHRHDPGHQHAGLLPHSHLNLASHRVPGLYAPDDEDDVQSSDLVAVVKGLALAFVAIVTDTVAVPAPEEQHYLVRTPAARGHDPPRLLTLPPRAPPA